MLMVNMVDFDIVVNEFEIHYIHIRINTLGKIMNPPAMGLTVRLLSFYKDVFGTELPAKC